MELNILLDPLIPAKRIFPPHPKNCHFLFGFVDVDEDGAGAGALGLGIGALGCGIRVDLRARRKSEHHRQNRDDRQAVEMGKW